MDFIAIDVKKGYNNLNTKVGVFVMSDTVQETALIVKIKAMMGHMSKAERRVADYIVQNPDEVIHLTVSELADLTSVSNATVIRTCQRIGSGNYQDLKITLAQEIVTPMQSINEELSFEDDPATILDKVFNTERQALDYTRNNIDMKELLRAVDVLQNAGTIHVLGMGNSRAIAQDLEHKLLRLGLNAVMRGDGHMDIISASFLKPCDVMFAISYSGSTMDVINAAKVAKQNGATVISLTNMGRSPLYDVADIHLSTSASESKYRIVALSSRIAQMAIVDTIYTLIALRKPDAVSGFHKLEKALGTTKY